MTLSEHRWEESVTRHRKEDSRLPHEHDEHDRSKAGDCTDVDDRPQPGECRASLLYCDEHRVRNVEFLVRSKSRHDEGHQDVEHRAYRQRSENSYGHVSLRILGLLRRRRYGVEPYVGEEDNGRAPHDAAPAVVTVPLTGGNERMPVGRVHVHEAKSDHKKYDGDLENYDEVV